jgi:hypothetical protein
MQRLLDKMKHDPDHMTMMTSSDPLTLMRLIEKIILAQTEDQYPYATVYEQECSLYGFNQNVLSNNQWYDRFNTKVDVGSAIGVTRQHKVLLEHVAQETHSAKYETLTPDQQEEVRTDAEEWYLSYIFLQQSGKQHNKLKMDLQNDFTTGDDRYPKNRQETLHLLDKYTKSAIVSQPVSEGTAFAQRGGQSGGKGKGEPYDKAYWKDKECYNCGKKGHPSNHCTKAKKSTKSDEDNKSTRSSKSRSSKSSSKSSKSEKSEMDKLAKQMKKSFATLKAQIETIHEDSDITGSEDEDSKASSHFQFQVQGATIGTPTGLWHPGQRQTNEPGDSDEIPGVQPEEGFVLYQAFEKRNAEVLFKQSHSKTKELDLKNIILLDSQSTMDLFCNKKLVKSVQHSSRPMTLASNGGTMKVTQKATVSGYTKKVWFSKKAITNILALSNLTKQYRVTYDSQDQMFVVHREAHNKPNMEFKMHSSGLHYYEPKDSDGYIFVNTVSGNKKGYSQRQIKGAEAARALYAKLGYPSMNNFKWVLKSNQIQDCQSL